MFRLYQLFFFICSFCLLLLFYEKNCCAATSLLPMQIKQQKDTVTKKKISNKIVDHSENNNQQQLKKDNQYGAAEAANESSPWSNAFNFHKTWGTQVDSRTGIFSAYIKVGSLISNLDHGPNIDLEMNYSSSSMADPDGLGQGWSWNLTHYNRLNNELSTSSGQNFHLKQTSASHWWPRYHKLKDIQIDGSKDRHFVITYPTALREILDNRGYETRLEQQDGRGVNFSYEGNHRLSSISDDIGHTVLLTYKTNYLIVTSYSYDGSRVSVRINYSNGQLHSVSLPDQNNQNEWSSSVDFNYSNHLLNEIDYPTGLKKKITYNCSDALKLESFNQTTDYKPLCVVTKENTNPGAGQPEMVTSYTYDYSSANEHNYLAYNTGLNQLQHSNRDILFEAPTNYTYQTMKDNGLVKRINTYNKYHLLINIKLISDSNNHLLSEEQNFFCSTDQSDGCAHTSFEDLPATYSLPLKTVIKTWGDAFGSPAVSTVNKKYDDQGRVIFIVDNDGHSKAISYCSPLGGGGCQAEPAGWYLAAPVEHITETPSKGKQGSVRSVYNSYHKQPNINGKGYILVLSSKVISSTSKFEEKREYYNDPKNSFTYGLLKETIFREKNTVHFDVIKHYRYRIFNHNTKVISATVETGHGKRMALPEVNTSLFTNQVITSSDASGKNISYYHYDGWGRLVQVDSAAGTPFAVSKHYAYTVSATLNQVIVTAGNGLQHKIIFDGAGRKLGTFDEQISLTGKMQPEKWFTRQHTYYDAYGRIERQINYVPYTYHTNNNIPIVNQKIIHYPIQYNVLTTKLYYDALGRVIRTDLPNGESDIKKYDDPHRCVVSYKQDNQGHYSAISVVFANEQGKPVRQILLPAPVISMPSVSLCVNANKNPDAKVSIITYDGYEQPYSSVNPAGQKVITRHDSWGRMTDITNPIGDQILNIYNANNQVTRKFAKPAGSKDRYLLFSAQYDAAGEMLWSTGEDGIKRRYTYTSDGQIATQKTPSGNIISWEYNELGLPTKETDSGKILLQTAYDKITALPVKKIDITGTTTYVYTDNGKIQQLNHLGKNGYPDYHLQWQYNLAGRVISVSDLSGGKILINYDDLGRKIAVYYQTINGTFLISSQVYDGFSRVRKIHYGSYAQYEHGENKERFIDYDAFGRQSDVTDVVLSYPVDKTYPDKTVIAESRYSYDKNDNIIQIIQNNVMDQNATLHYQYDALDNLIAMSCSGSTGLPLCPRDTMFKDSGLKEAPAIIAQHYTFNPLNRISQVTEELNDFVQGKRLSKIMAYNYSDPLVPLRLQQISTSWNTLSPIYGHFTYDEAGNMTTDGEGNHITYNALNQLTKVVKVDGKQSTYVYDGTGRKVREITPERETNYLFYVGKSLIGEQMTYQNKRHIVSYLGDAKAINGIIREYYEKNYKGDITAVLRGVYDAHNTFSLSRYKKRSQYNIYSPYGMVSHQHSATISLPLYQQTLPGFNSERTDPSTGWQFLGAGHRTYNPGQRYFLSEDPAGNGYAFASNNPIMNTDPSGNIPQWMGKAFYIIGGINSFGLGFVHKKWAAIAGTAITAGLATVISGFALVTAGIPAIVTASATGYMAALGGVSVAASAVPANKGLNIAGAVSGTLQMLGVVAVAGISGMPTPSAFSSWWMNTNNAEMEMTALASAVDNEAQISLAKVSDELQSAIPSEMLIKKNGLLASLSLALRISSDSQIESLWQSLSATKNVGRAMDNSMLSLFAGAKHSATDIDTEQLAKLINLKLRIIDISDTGAENQYISLFGQIANSFSSMHYQEGLFLKDVITDVGDSAIIRKDNTQGFDFLKLVDTNEFDSGQNIWGVYHTHEHNVYYMTGDYYALDLKEFFNSKGMFHIHYIQNVDM